MTTEPKYKQAIETSTEIKPEYINCPFCNKIDFDQIGLKIHISRGWCDVYNKIDADEWYREEK
jgi:hypothetical protein